MKMIHSARSQGFWYNRSVIDEHHRSNSSEEVSMTIVWEELLVLIFSLLRYALLDCEVEELILSA